MHVSNCFAFIFARGGSKGLPNKNILKLNGKPLIAYSIEHAHQIVPVGQIFVSTDSEEIASVAKVYGAEVIMRPAELASDTSPEIDAWRHALSVLETRQRKVETFISLPCTCPLRRVEDVKKAIDLFAENKADIVLSVMEAFRNPWFNMVTKNERTQFYEIAIRTDKRIFRRQDAPKALDLTAAFYVTDPMYINKCDHILDGKVAALEISRSTGVDIDDEFDFDFANFLLTRGIK